MPPLWVAALRGRSLFRMLYAAEADPWAWVPHIEVWMVVLGVVAIGGYVSRVIAPKIPVSERGEGPAVSPAQKRWFVFGVVLLWLASDWPMHDLAEQYLYFLHMVQHMVLTLIVPAVFWLATPRWLARLVIPQGSVAWTWLRRLAHPVPAAVIYNAVTIVTHWTVLVNTSVEVAPVHYTVHLVMVATAFLMWIPVVGPWPELRIGAVGQCVYLFLQSIIPTVPGAWLTMAETPVYSVYDRGLSLWGIDVILDQQYAGLFMKLGGGFFLWAVIIVIFFRWALAQERDARRFNLVREEDGIDYRGPAATPLPAAVGAPPATTGTAELSSG
jgi:putative membrane protein